MNVEKRPLSEITTLAIEVLSKELGPSDTLRFMNQFRNGNGNYTLERDALFKDVTLDQILGEIRQARRPGPGGPASDEG